MSSNRSTDEHNRHILQAIASGKPVTQRSLAKEMGVALGLTNLLIRRLVAKGYLRIARIGTRHIRYLMTAEGWEALGYATRASLENTLHLYTQTREQLRTTLALVSDRCDADSDGRKNVLFYGAGDVAEIAFVSLQRTDLTLVGVVDDHRTGRFFGLPICDSGRLTPESLDGVPYAQLIITSVRHAQSIRARLDARLIPISRVAFL